MFDPIFSIVILITAQTLRTQDLVHYTDKVFTVTAADEIQLKTWDTEEPAW